MTVTLQRAIKQLPLRPGVYQFFDDSGHLLYIGKATQLRSRVQSYFRGSTTLSDAKRLMVAQICEMKTTVVDTADEALLLETTLIKQHKPPFNVLMKDDKNFQYLHITDDLYPRIETTRRIGLGKRSGRYFGPYTSGLSLRRTLRLLKSIFRYCTTSPMVKKGQVIFPARPCLEYHLGRCLGPCANAITPTQYKKIFDQIEHFLLGDYEPITCYVEREMDRAATQERFELAAIFRDQLLAIERLMSEQKVVSTKNEHADYLSLSRLDGTAAVNVFTVRKGKMIHQEVFVMQQTRGQSDEEILFAFRDQYYSQTLTRPRRIFMSTEQRKGRHRKLLELGIANAEERLHAILAAREEKEKIAARGLAEIGGALSIPAKRLQRIEIYDNSNMQGTHPVASMVVFVNGEPRPTEYRKFKIKTVVGPDDFASMREVMNRRLRHLPTRTQGMTDPWPRPDLIVIDGGKGQLSAAKAMIDALGVRIPVISLAKREEEIFVPDQSAPIRLPKNSPGLLLMQRMRDEAHRFAIGFYRRTHLKGLV